MNNQKTESKTIYFFADESWVDIEGKKHLILGSVVPSNLNETCYKIYKLKQKIGISPLNEVKWNMKGLTEEQRIELSNGMIEILVNDCVGMISVVETEDKQYASQTLVKQIHDYCKKTNVSAYILHIDQDLVPKLQVLEDFIKSNLIGEPDCIGLQSLISSKDQMIQCCDIFIGLLRTVMVHLLNEVDKKICYIDEGLDETVELDLTDYILLSTRYVIWGDTSITIEDLENGALPYKRSMGLGFRLVSSISEETKALLENQVATVYMGCMH